MCFILSLLIDCNSTITTNAVELTNPDYPKTIPKSKDCKRLIKFKGKTVTLTFLELSFNNPSDPWDPEYQECDEWR